MGFLRRPQNLKNLCRSFDKSVVFCARNSVLVKKSTKVFKNKSGQVVLYKLYLVKLYFLVSRRRFRSNMTLESLHSVLDALVPKCSELVAGCQTGSGAILRGGNCCRLLFEDKLVYRYVFCNKTMDKAI